MSFQEFQKAPNRLSQREIGFLIVAAVVVLLVLYLLAITNNYLANLWPDGGEFTLLRAGGQAFLYDQLEPYSGTVAALVQEQVYGRPAKSGEDLYILDVPFHLLIFYFPLALIPKTLIARALWMALSEIALAGFLYFSFRLADRRIPPIFIGLIAISALTSYYLYRTLLEGSPTVLLALTYTGILFSLKAGHDEFAGALMAFSSFQWEMGGLFLAFVAMWVFWEKRWRVFAGVGMLAFVMLLISFLWYPGWVLPFLRAAWNNYRAGIGFSTHDLLQQIWPQSGSALGWFVTGILVLALGLEWLAAREKHFNHFLWAASLTLAATPLLGQRVELDQLFPLTLPIILVTIVARERWKKLGDGIAFLLLWFFFGLSWLSYEQGLPEWIGISQEQFLFLFWPVFTVLGLYWARWWMVRPPRTWLDRFAYKEWE
jgi:hypothetical protein